MKPVKEYLADNLNRLGTETAFDILTRAKKLEREGKDIIHLSLGEPDFDTPKHICEAAKKALDSGMTHYGPPPGQPAVREAIGRSFTKRYGFNVSPEQVVVTPGAKPIMSFVIMALINSGDEVLYPNPGFPIYESMINYVGGTAVPMPLLEELDFSIDPDALERSITPRTKLMIINSPNNPCGSIIPRDTLKRIAELAVEHDLLVLSDEIYKDIYFEGSHESITQFPGMVERTVILDGPSKSWAMTGWRLGYGIFPEWMVEPIVRLAINLYSCTASFSQMVLVEAVEGTQEPVREIVAEFAARRSVVVDGLNSIKGITCRTPKGAFYAFPNITATGLNSQEFANKALYEAGVALVGGTSFGSYGEGYARVSFANNAKNITAAMERIDKVLNG